MGDESLSRALVALGRPGARTAPETARVVTASGRAVRSWGPWRSPALQRPAADERLRCGRSSGRAPGHTIDRRGGADAMLGNRRFGSLQIRASDRDRQGAFLPRPHILRAFEPSTRDAARWSRCAGRGTMRSATMPPRPNGRDIRSPGARGPSIGRIVAESVPGGIGVPAWPRRRVINSGPGGTRRPVPLGHPGRPGTGTSTGWARYKVTDGSSRWGGDSRGSPMAVTRSPAPSWPTPGR